MAVKRRTAKRNTAARRKAKGDRATALTDKAGLEGQVVEEGKVLAEDQVMEEELVQAEEHETVQEQLSLEEQPGKEGQAASNGPETAVTQLASNDNSMTDAQQGAGEEPVTMGGTVVARGEPTATEQELADRLQLLRPLVFLDLETTGLSIKTDNIVEIGCVKLHPGDDRRRETFTRRIKPPKSISAKATQVHGIRNADVADCPTFGQLAQELLDFLRDCDLSGFNIEKFDLPLLTKEFDRAGIPFPPAAVHVVDTIRIFKRHEPHNLATAFKFYCGRELQGHHTAEADASAAADILLEQVRRYGAMPCDVGALHQYTRPPEPNEKIVWQRGIAILNFGMHKTRTLQDVAKDDRDYLQWMLGSNFTQSVKDLVTAALA